MANLYSDNRPISFNKRNNPTQLNISSWFSDAHQLLDYEGPLLWAVRNRLQSLEYIVEAPILEWKALERVIDPEDTVWRRLGVGKSVFDVCTGELRVWELFCHFLGVEVEELEFELGRR